MVELRRSKLSDLPRKLCRLKALGQAGATLPTVGQHPHNPAQGPATACQSTRRQPAFHTCTVAISRAASRLLVSLSEDLAHHVSLAYRRDLLPD